MAVADDPPVSEAQFAEAGRYLFRRLDASWTDHDEAELAAWLAADPVHRAAWQEVQALDGLAGQALDQVGRRRRRLVGGLGILLLTALLSGAWWWADIRDRAVVASLEPVVYATRVGERRQVTLPDGSRVDLDADTQLRWLPAAADDGRQLLLDRGRVYLQVVADPQRPLAVQAGLAEVRVLGTSFVVDLRGDQVAVTLAEGAVRVDCLAGSGGRSVDAVRLVPGQQALVDHRIEARHVDPTAIGAWRGEHLVFSDRPLASVLAELQRYHGEPLRAAPSVAGRELSGKIRHGALHEQLATLAAVLELAVVPRAEGGFLLRPR